MPNSFSTGSNSTANISADNKSLINDDLYSLGVAIAVTSVGIAGDIAVNNLETTVQTAINKSEVSAKTVNVKPNDDISQPPTWKW